MSQPHDDLREPVEAPARAPMEGAPTPMMAEAGAGRRAWAPWLAGMALGLHGAAALRAAAMLAGPSPGALLGTGAAVAAGLAIGAALGPTRAGNALPLLAGPAGVVLAGPLLGALGQGVEGLGGPVAAPGLLMAGLAALASVPAGRRGAGSSAPAAALGLALGALLPAWLGAALAAAGLAMRGPAAGSGARPEPAPLREMAERAAGAAAATAAGAWLHLMSRAAFDPSALGFFAFAFGGVLALGLGARARRARPGGAALLGGGVLAVAWAGLGPLSARFDALSAALFELAHGGAPAALAMASPALGLGLLAGGAAGAIAGGPALGVGVGLGLMGALAAADAGPWAPLVAAGALGASAVLWGQRRAQLQGVGLAGLAAVLAFGLTPPEPATLVVGRALNNREPGARERDAKIRAGVAAAWQGFEGGVPGGVSAPPPTWNKKKARDDGAARSTVSPEQPAEPVLVEIDGLVTEARSRAASTEALAGQLARLLAPETRRALLLGDDAGRALQGLGAFGQVVVATPLAQAIRGVAALDPAAELRWLSGGVRLLPLHPELALRTRGDQDAIVEISRAPWGDGARAGLSSRHFAVVRDRLTAGGVYVLVLHLGWWRAGEPAAAVQELARRFDDVQLWLPPTGADSAILVASQAPLPLDRLITRLGGVATAPLPEPLRALGLDSALDLASLAVLGDAGARDWAASTDRADPLGLRPLHLSDALLSRPTLHLAALHDRLARPDQIWATPLPEGLEAPLQSRLSARGAFLAVVGDAARGDMEAVFDAARSLRLIEGEVGRSALDPLLEPHLERGRDALKRAEAEGVGSKGWDEARSAAVTAQMLNPDSPAPLVLLGDIALGQGNTRQAEESYQGAIDRDRDDVAAWTGLARVHRVRKDLPRAESALREAARAGARQWSTWQNLGVFLLEQGRNAEAEDALRRSASLVASLPEPAPGERSPARAAPHLALAELYLDTDAPTRALIELERALQAGAGGYAWYLRGRAHFELAQLDLAEEDFRAAVLADPELIEARGAIGHLRALARDWPAAAESFRAVLARDPNNGPARENLRQVLQEQAADEERRRQDRGAPSAPQPQLGVQGP